MFSKSKKTEISLFINPNDLVKRMKNSLFNNFSELPYLNNISFGTNIYFLFQKIIRNWISILIQSMNTVMAKLRELQGEFMPAHFAEQSEERTHNIFEEVLTIKLTLITINHPLFSI